MEAFKNMVIDKLKNISDLEENLIRVENKFNVLSCRASDFMQEITKVEQTGKRKRKREVQNWFEEVKRVKSEFHELKGRIQDKAVWKNLSSGDTIQKINARVDELMEQSKDYDGRLLLGNYKNRGEPRVTVKLFGRMVRGGLKTIKNWLVKEKLYKIGIYGKGGVGKTTLVQHIHNHLLKNSNFRLVWVTVSQEFSIKGLQEKIAKLLEIDFLDEDDENQRAAMLSRTLARYPCVFILDDVWEEFCLDRVGIVLGANKCKLILTTRSSQLCDRMQCQKQYRVTTLDSNEAWDLFNHKLGQETVLSEEIEEIAKLVAKECAGLPLGITTVAGSMRRVTDVHEWRNALEQLKACSIGYKEMEDNVFPVLEWSFNRLHGCERLCFLYCCLYSEDCEIEREELIDLFIMAELIPRRKTRESEFDHGHTILNKLIKVCMLEEEGTNSVKMHDLIRDMALRITSWKCISNVSGNVPRFLVKSLEPDSTLMLEQSEWSEDLNAVSFNGVFRCSGQIEIPKSMSPICPNLVTVRFDEVKLERFPDSFFRYMDGIKVLSFTYCRDLKELPNSISDRVNITALILRGCGELKLVPPLEKLEQLQVLDLSGTSIEDLPQGLEKLVKLQCLDLLDTKIKKKTIPKGTFSKFHHLRHFALPTSVLVNDPQVFMNRLELFTGDLSFTNVYNQFVKPPYWPNHYAIVVKERPLSVFEHYLPIFPTRRDKMFVFTGCIFHEGLDAIMPPEDIRELSLLECFGLSNVLFQHIMKRSKDLYGLDIRSSDAEILLKYLSPPPRSSPSVMASAERSEATSSRYADPLQNLKKLQLYDLPNLLRLIDWALIPTGTFSSLEFLYISKCHKLKKLFPGQLLQQNLLKLKRLDVRECNQLEEIAPNNDDLNSSTGPNTATAEEGMPKLAVLHLRRLPQLFYICSSNVFCHSIREIWVFGCPKVKKLPLSLPCNTLKEIRGSEEWWESLEWDNPSAKNDLLSRFRKGWNA